MDLQQDNNKKWVKAKPVPFPYHLPVFLWKRMTFWRDEHGRKATLYFPLLKKYR